MAAATAANEHDIVFGVMRKAACETVRNIGKDKARGRKIAFVIEPIIGGGNARGDLLIKFPTGAKWLIEVLGREARSPRARAQKAALAVRFGDAIGATPVLAQSAGDDFAFFSARTGRPLPVPALK